MMKKTTLVAAALFTLMGCAPDAATFEDGSHSEFGHEAQAMDLGSQVSSLETKKCGTRKREFAPMVDFVAEHWNEYERFVEGRTGLNIKGCLRRRFEKNGKVHCEHDNIHGCKDSRLGVAKYLSKTAHLCPRFLDQVKELDGAANRAASYVALLSHEWGHTCFRNEKKADRIDQATFAFLKRKIPGVTDADCLSCAD